MAFCTDREDVVSLSLTVVHQLLYKYGVDAADIGRSAGGPTAHCCSSCSGCAVHP